VTAAHNESTRFDAFFVLTGPGPASVKALLGLYTALTGPPFLPPIYGLYLGDSDCYHNDRRKLATPPPHDPQTNPKPNPTTLTP
jgi:hypothetical protein